MALKPLRPCRHPGCGALTREGYCPKTSHRKRPAEPRRSTTAGTACPSGRTICARRSSCGSRSAASAPRGIRQVIPGTGPGPRWWTTSSLTEGTGASSSTRPTTRACARPATTARRLWRWRRNGGKIVGDFAAELARVARTLGRGRAGVCAPGRVRGGRRPRPLPPPLESLGAKRL